MVKQMKNIATEDVWGVKEKKMCLIMYMKI